MNSRPRAIHFVSLGCAKNRVDSEVMAGIAENLGVAVVTDPEQADILVVNTCSFIESAREESIEVLLEMGRIAKEGNRRLIAAGCMAQQSSSELSAEMPEIDHLIGTANLEAFADLLVGKEVPFPSAGGGHFLQKGDTPRFIAPNTFSTYVKIADGCNRKCAFCAIPSIRGRAHSRPLEEIVAEATRLAKRGVRELNLVAQDTGAYGRDLPERPDLIQLVRRLDEIPGLSWIRLLYLYPDSVSNDLLEAIRGARRVVPYFDVPIQHASSRMLRRMRRGHGKGALKDVISRIREQLPHAFLRTTVLVGHPGETADDVNELLELMEWARFDHLGVFRYSDEAGTASHGAEDPVSARDSYNRFRKVMAVQRKVSIARQRTLMGQTLEVLVEDAADDEGYVLSGRHAGQAPEIDGVTYLVSTAAAPGEIIRARVVETGDYDIVAKRIDDIQ